MRINGITFTEEQLEQEKAKLHTRRLAWGETARRLPLHGVKSNKLLLLSGPEQTRSYSFLGTALQSCIQWEEPGYIEWCEPEVAPWDGETFQAVMDTTVTIADYYGIQTELVDLLDDMENEGHEVEELIEMVTGAGYPFLAGGPRQ